RRQTWPPVKISEALNEVTHLSAELQPAERLWSLIDEPLANRDFKCLEALEQVLAQRCRYLSAQMSDFIQGLTDFHWWPSLTPAL
ncbi:MAG: hypothetical protein AAFY57_13440, partial [Cyanobacteria bacterium J06642_2]